jgi:hypothetical protein
MRLINTHTLKIEETHDDKRRYAILSHTWGSAKDEVTLQEMMATWLWPSTRNKSGYTKIEKMCEIARDVYNLEWAWADTCCIDRTSCAELSEAINTMFRWYKNAEVCLAFLSDIDETPSSFEKSRWFTRGWTLQELLAPKEVKFLDKSWVERGTKVTLSEQISRITGVATGVLDQSIDLTDIPAAERMSWASKRETTRPEDMAYCLLGIFDINMSVLYGEREKAFIRLQEEIVRQGDDLSIFIWTNPNTTSEFCGILARSPAYFSAASMVYANRITESSDVDITNRGIRFTSDLAWNQNTGLATLNLNHSFKSDERTIGIYLRRFDTGLFARARPSELSISRRYISGPRRASAIEKKERQTFAVLKSLAASRSVAFSNKALSIKITLPKGWDAIQALPDGFWDREKNLLYPADRGTFTGFIGFMPRHGTKPNPVVFCYRDGVWACKDFQASDWDALEEACLGKFGGVAWGLRYYHKSESWYDYLSKFPDETFNLCAKHLQGRAGAELPLVEIREPDDKKMRLVVCGGGEERIRSCSPESGGSSGRTVVGLGLVLES